MTIHVRWRHNQMENAKIVTYAMTDDWWLMWWKGFEFGEIRKLVSRQQRKLSKVKSEWWRKRVSHACDHRQSIQLESVVNFLSCFHFFPTKDPWVEWHNLAAFRLNNKMHAHSFGKCINRCISLFGSRIQWLKWSAHILRTKHELTRQQRETKKIRKQSIGDGLHRLQNVSHRCSLTACHSSSQTSHALFYWSLCCSLFILFFSISLFSISIPGVLSLTLASTLCVQVGGMPFSMQRNMPLHWLAAVCDVVA